METNVNNTHMLVCPKLNAVYYSARRTFASICFIAFQVKYRFVYCVQSIVEHWILQMLPYHFSGFGERKAQSRTTSITLSLNLSGLLTTRLCAGWYSACNWLYPRLRPLPSTYVLLRISKPQLAIWLSHVVGTISWNFMW